MAIVCEKKGQKVEEHAGQGAIDVSYSLTDLGYWQRSLAAYVSEQTLKVWAVMEAIIPFFPVELVLVPLIRRNPSSARGLVFLASVFSMVGAIYSYAVGHLLHGHFSWKTSYLSQSIFTELLAKLLAGLHRWGESLVFFGALFPAPLSLLSIGAGFLHIGLLPFLVTVFLSRMIRFYLVSFLTLYFTVK